ncbi:MAG: DUF6624 domain-containing protein [Lysobacterales bacterium]
MSTENMLSRPALMLAIVFVAGCETLPNVPLQPPVSFAYVEYCERVDDPGSADGSIAQKAEDAIEPPEHDAKAVARYMLEKSAFAVADSATGIDACIQTFERGEQIFTRTLNGQQQVIREIGGYKKSSDEPIAQVQESITLMWQNDQSARGTYVALQTQDKTGAAFWAERRAAAHTRLLDGQSASFIESLLAQYPWIDRDRFGPEVSAHAWLLTQHADHRPDLQQRVLSRMEPLLESNGVSRKNYAYLWDRVAVNSGRSQRYGTQPTWECENGAMALKPLEDPANVNARRTKMGLNTVEQGLASMTAQYCGATKQ